MSNDLEDIFFIADSSIISPIHTPCSMTHKSIARSSTQPPRRLIENDDYFKKFNE